MQTILNFIKWLFGIKPPEVTLSAEPDLKSIPLFPASTEPRFMTRAARVRAGFQKDAPTWWRALHNARIVGMTPNQYWNFYEPRKVATLQS